MIKRILRAGLGSIFLVFLLFTLLLTAVKFRLLSADFWKGGLGEAQVYEQLASQVEQFRSQLEDQARRQTGGAALPKQLSVLLAVDLSAGRFQELTEINIERIFAYLNRKSQELVLFLPVKEWDLPVALLGQPKLASWTGETPVREAAAALMPADQVDQLMNGLGQAHGVLGYLIWIWLGLLLGTALVLAGHFFLGEGLVDRLTGTAWVIMISGLIVKLIGLGASKFVGLALTASKGIPPWVGEMGKSLVSQFFALGEGVGLALALAGAGVIVAVPILAKQGKIKEEKTAISKKKRVFAFLVGAVLGLFVLLGALAGVVVLAGGKVNFKLGPSSVGSGGEVEKATLGETPYQSKAGWSMLYPVGWEVIQDKESEGFLKKPEGAVTNWGAIEIKPMGRTKEVDSGSYIELVKSAIETGKVGLPNAAFAEEPYEELEGGVKWKRFVFSFEYDAEIADQQMRLHVYRVEYFPPEKGDGFSVMVRVPVESWEKYGDVAKEAAKSFEMGE